MVVVRGRNAKGLGWASQPIRFRTAAAPTKPDQTASTASSITVTWPEYSPTSLLNGVETAPYTVKKYKVRLYRGSEFDKPARVGTSAPPDTISTILHTTSSASERTHTFSSADLVPGDEYWADVAALVEDGADEVWSGWSTVATVQAEADAPLKPNKPTKNEARSRQIKFNVQAPFNNGKPAHRVAVPSVVEPPPSLALSARPSPTRTQARPSSACI